MREVMVDVHISAPREDVFDFVADLGGRPAWTDHYLKDYRLARPNPYGLGAAARFLLRAPFAKEYVELAIVECDRPRRIVEEAHVGRRGRLDQAEHQDGARTPPLRVRGAAEAAACACHGCRVRAAQGPPLRRCQR